MARKYKLQATISLSFEANIFLLKSCSRVRLHHRAPQRTDCTRAPVSPKGHFSCYLFESQDCRWFSNSETILVLSPDFIKLSSESALQGCEGPSMRERYRIATQWKQSGPTRRRGSGLSRRRFVCSRAPRPGNRVALHFTSLSDRASCTVPQSVSRPPATPPRLGNLAIPISVHNATTYRQVAPTAISRSLKPFT